jgi:hypothetical protein
MVARLLIEPGAILLTKPGIDVRSEPLSENDLLLGAGIYPQGLLQVGTVNLTTGGATVIPYGRTLPWRPVFAIQGTQESGEGFVTFPALRTNSNNSGVQTTAAPGLSSISFTTEYDRTIWYLIFNRQMQ